MGKQRTDITMELPKEIADIIAVFGNRKLTVSEKGKLFDWYRQLNNGVGVELSKEEEKETEDRILRNIMNCINKHPPFRERN